MDLLIVVGVVQVGGLQRVELGVALLVVANNATPELGPFLATKVAVFLRVRMWGGL
jgi:hypothetical protein